MCLYLPFVCHPHAMLAEDLIDNINAHLPDDIRAIGMWPYPSLHCCACDEALGLCHCAAYRRVTNGFNCKLWCSARQYDYILPTYCVAPGGPEQSARGYRIDKVRTPLIR